MVMSAPSYYGQRKSYLMFFLTEPPQSELTQNISENNHFKYKRQIN